MTPLVEWDGEPFALLIERDNGRPYLVPPIVLDRNGSPIEGRQVLAAILELLIIRNATARDLAMVDRRMAAISEQLGEPVGPPDDEDLASG